MSASSPINEKFIKELTEIIRSEMSNENFGVSELAERVSMSRSNLLRKIQKASGLTASVFIRSVRLTEAQLLLQKKELTVSEVSYTVGFGSVSYFVKCYREQFGYPPGEEADQFVIEELSEKEITSFKKPAWRLPAIGIAILVIISLIFQFTGNDSEESLEKSILVLPFKNDSADSSNVYIINGLMEAILNNLQQVGDLRVLSRTTSEFYGSSGMSMQEIAEELDVTYIIEGSGQKQNDEILLTVQLIRGSTDSHLWSERYFRETQDIFNLQAEVAKDIASEVSAKISPEEIERIEKVLTSNIIAYEHYLKGLEAINRQDFEGLAEGVIEFKKALLEDPELAEAHAYMVMGYYYDDYYRGQKTFAPEIQFHADQAYTLDKNSSVVLISKGLAAMHAGDYKEATGFFEEVVKINPNSARAYNYLSDIYFFNEPDTKKYLEYALKGIRTEMAGQDSTALSFSYLHISNALIQTGFIKLAEEFIRKSMALDSTNLFSQYLFAYIQFAEDQDFELVEKRLIQTLKKDTTRIDIIQEIAKVNYANSDFEDAVYYYDKMNYIKSLIGSSLFETEDIKVAYALEQVGRADEAAFYYDRYWQYAKNDSSIYGPLIRAAYYGAKDQIDEGIAELKLFTKADGISLWFILFLKDDPILEHLSPHPDYEVVLQQITDTFWRQHEELREYLSEAEIMINR